ncbi:MAG: nicotinate-nucleotide adenylyltransferase [Oscillospiraceae bacterium]|nr:nicotinate-nucleotide adenylyltransferase [Oscillospiraceae bacterium]MDD4413263.1 nicotinate-nucleotide adenylyltransferase [Oscillospiraceae bacterium]
MKIGVFGGAFDPIHQGHLRLACEFANRLSFDRVILIPSSIPPHKLRSVMASAQDRIEMCRLATKDNPLFEISDIEIKRGGVSYTADTLNQLAEKYQNPELFLIMGADMFLTLGTWHRFDDIIKNAVFCAARRNDCDTQKLKDYAEVLQKRGARCIIEEIPEFPVSSTDIRRKIQMGESLEGLVSPLVDEYIKTRGLYKSTQNNGNSDRQFIEIIRGRLSPRRFNHSLAVAEQAAHLATIYDADPKKAYTAGILHDIMKDAGAQAQLQMLSDFDIILYNVEMGIPSCWHAIAGAAFIEHILRIDDNDIINAVRYHTTARAGMSPLEATIFIADFTSADRDYPDVDEMRRLAEQGMEPAIEYALSYTIRELAAKSALIHPDSVHAYNQQISARRKGGRYSGSKTKR